MTLNCDTPMPIHEITQSTTEQMMLLPGRVIPSKLLTRASQEETLRKEITPYKGSTCKPPSKPPDRQNHLNDKISRRVLPYINPKGRSLPKPPNIHNTNEEGKIWNYRPPPNPPKIENMEEETRIWHYRPPPKPPNIQNTDGERIGVPEKKSLPYAEPSYRPPPKPPDVLGLSGMLLKDLGQT